jgi:hypothetical protein
MTTKMPPKTKFPVLFSRYYPELPSGVGVMKKADLEAWIKKQLDAGVTLVPRRYTLSGTATCKLVY